MITVEFSHNFEVNNINLCIEIEVSSCFSKIITCYVIGKGVDDSFHMENKEGRNL